MGFKEMIDRVTYCRGCKSTIYLNTEGGRKVAYNYTGPHVGQPHKEHCPNPVQPKSKLDKYMTEAERKLRKDPWWAK